MRKECPKIKTVEELEQVTGIQRNQPRTPTLRDRDFLERKMLGPLWGKRRRKQIGPP